MRAKNANKKTPAKKNLKTKKKTPAVKKVSPNKQKSIKRMINQWNSVSFVLKNKFKNFDITQLFLTVKKVIRMRMFYK